MKNRQVKIGAIISYVAIVFNIVVGLIYTPWMIDKIGKSQYGIYTLANSLITLFLIDFGLSSATARFVSNYHAAGEEERVDNFLGIVYKFYTIVDAVIFVVLFVLYFFIDKIYINLTAEELKQFKVVYIIAASFNLVNLPFVTQNGILTAYEKFIQLKLADLIYRLFIVGLTVFVLLEGWGLYALVGANAVAGLLIIIYKQIIIKTTTTVRVNFRYSDRKMMKSIFAFSFWTTVYTLSARLVFNITPSILGIVADTAAIAVFGVISTIEGYAYTFTTAINGMFMPKISRTYLACEDEAHENIMPLMINVGRFQFALNGLLVVGFALVGKSFINVWMGADYSDAYLGILLVIIPGMFFNSLQVANTAMVVKNKVNIQAYIGLACGVLNVACSFFLSKYYGVIGASFAIFISYTVRAIIYHFVHKKVMKFDIKRFIVKCYLKMFPSLVLTFSAGMVLNYFMKDGGWLILGVKVLAITIIFLLFVFLFGITKEERKNFINKFKKKTEAEEKR